jgi:hypothetical protein
MSARCACCYIGGLKNLPTCKFSLAEIYRSLESPDRGEGNTGPESGNAGDEISVLLQV